MTAASLLKSLPPSGLQPVDLARDLGGLADLLDLCFSAEMDAAGRGVVREMRFLSHLGPGLNALRWLGLSQQPWDLGFVWLEAGRVVGSVSTTRSRARSQTWLVANVAVHPDHRRRGVALALMQATLDLIRRRSGDEAILQVDDDNLGAIALYRQLGFTRVSTRTAWTRPVHTPPPPVEASPFAIRPRAPGEATEQMALATLARPDGLTWNQPLRREDFAPGLLARLDRFFSGQSEEHWVVEAQGRLAGSLTVRFNWSEGDRMTLLVHPGFQGRLERPLLGHGLRRLGARASGIRLEHPADDEPASAALRELGFQPGRTLRWMRLAWRQGQA